MNWFHDNFCKRHWKKIIAFFTLWKIFSCFSTLGFIAWTCNFCPIRKKNAFSSEKYCIFVFRLMFRFDKQKRKKNIHDPEGRAAVWFYNKWNDERDFPMISNFSSAQHQLFDFWIRHHLLIRWMKFPQKFSKKKFSLGHSVENQEFSITWILCETTERQL